MDKEKMESAKNIIRKFQEEKRKRLQAKSAMERQKNERFMEEAEELQKENEERKVLMQEKRSKLVEDRIERMK